MTYQQAKKTAKHSLIQKEQSQIPLSGIDNHIQTNFPSPATTLSIPSQAERDAIRRSFFSTQGERKQSDLTIGESSNKSEQIADRVTANDTPHAKGQVNFAEKELEKTLKPISSSINNSAIQRKISIKGIEQKTDYIGTLREEISSNLNPIYQEVLKTKPKAIQKLEEENNTNIDRDFMTWLEEWNKVSNDYEYENSQTGRQKLVKDVIKYYLHKKYEWHTVGSAAYMTGDATGLTIATLIDPKLTLKILKGEKPFGENEKNLSIYKNDNLPSLFDEVKNRGQVSESNIDEKVEKGRFKGTADVYKQRYNEHTAKAVKPWNKETYYATQIIGRLYNRQSEEIMNQIKNQLLPQGKEEEVQAQYQNIQDYKNSLGIGNKPCILIWQRRSGQGGGAHKELDSAPTVLQQIALTISKDFSERTIILVGDKTVEKADLVKEDIKNEIIDLHEYWKTAKNRDGNLIFHNREQQNHFIHLFSQENNAVSIGMRSGSLEASALLGGKTIFLDDLGNKAQGRMEYWAGDAAYKRADVINQGDLDEHEKKHEGAIPNYKRVGTQNQLGTIAGDRFKLFNDLRTQVEDKRKEIEEYSENQLSTPFKESSSTKKTQDLGKKIKEIQTKIYDTKSVIMDYQKELKKEKYEKSNNHRKNEDPFNKNVKKAIKNTESSLKINFQKLIRDMSDLEKINDLKKTLQNFEEFLRDFDFEEMLFLTKNELQQISQLVKYLNKTES